MAILPFCNGFPEGGKLLIFILAYGVADSVHGTGSQVIMGACALHAADKADVAFIIVGL